MIQLSCKCVSYYHPVAKKNDIADCQNSQKNIIFGQVRPAAIHLAGVCGEYQAITLPTVMHAW